VAGNAGWGKRLETLISLGRWLRSVDPSPVLVRDLTRRSVEQALDARLSVSQAVDGLSPLLENCGRCRHIVADEIAAVLDTTVQSPHDPGAATRAIELAATMWLAHSARNGFWARRSADFLRRNEQAAMAAAEHDPFLRRIYLDLSLLTVGQALAMPNGLTCLLARSGNAGWTVDPYLERAFQSLHGAIRTSAAEVADLEAVGEFLRSHPAPPWTDRPLALRTQLDRYLSGISPAMSQLSPLAFASGAALILISIEGRGDAHPYVWDGGPLPELAPYISRRFGWKPGPRLSDLPVPAELTGVFRDWASHAVSFIREPPGKGVAT
jgi:hypothetical protein